MALAGLRGDRQRLLARLSKPLPPPDQEVLAEMAADPGGGQGSCPTPPRRSAGRRRGRSRPGGGQPAVGFPLGEVGVPTWLWHGTADEDVPVAAARWMAQAIPGCRATFTDEGHLMGLRHANQAIEAIRAAAAYANPGPGIPKQPAATSGRHGDRGLIDEPSGSYATAGATTPRR